MSTVAERELARSTLYCWLVGETREARLAVRAVAAAAVTAAVCLTLVYATGSAWPGVLGGVLIAILTLATCVLGFLHTAHFESALAADCLLPQSEKALAKVDLLFVPFGRHKLRRRLIELAEARAVEAAQLDSVLE